MSRGFHAVQDDLQGALSSVRALRGREGCEALVSSPLVCALALVAVLRRQPSNMVLRWYGYWRMP